MKRLFLLLLSFHFISQASSIIYKAIPYIGSPDSKASALHAVSGVKTVDLEKLASDYWNHLTTGEGDYYLYSLITDETLQHGNNRFGLIAEDVHQIQKYLLKFKMFHNTQYFAFSVLPEWLKEIYENKQNELIKKIDLQDSEFEFLKEKKVHLGLLAYIVQNYYQQQLGHKKYFYVKKRWEMSPEVIDSKVKALAAIIEKVASEYVYIENLETIEHEDLPYDHIIIIQEDLTNQKMLHILKKVLKYRPDVTVIIALDDDQRALAHNFNINSDLVIKNLVITGRSLMRIGNSFLLACVGLESLQLPDGLIQIGDYFLDKCTDLKGLQLPDTLKQVGIYFLSHCISLKSLHLPNALKQVGHYFLYRCMSLSSLQLPHELMQVGNYFLLGCNSLKWIGITKDVYNRLEKENQLSNISRSIQLLF